jgi:hypothetical protein
MEVGLGGLRRGRGSARFVIGALLGVAAFQVGPAPAGATGATDAAAGSKDIDALVLGKAKSPILRAKRSRFGLDTARHAKTDRRHHRHYDLLIVDGHHLKPRALRRRAAVRRFLAAERWIAAYDVSPAHHKAIRRHTGFDVVGSGGKNQSGMLLFRVSTASGSPTVEILHSDQSGARGAKHLGRGEKRKLKRRHSHRVARLAHRRIRSNPTPAAAASEAAPAAANPSAVACPPLDPAPSPDLQHVAWCYTEAGHKATPNGYWTKDRKPFWIDPYPAAGQQTASWTMNHRFDVFLNNDVARPQGQFQTIGYSLNGQFTPKRASESWFRMFENFTSFAHGKRHLERAWWTGRAEVGVRPDTATDGKLLLQGSHPQSANSETQYSSGEEFSIGFTGTAARPDAGLGVGLNFSYTSSNSKSYAIPDWGVQNQTAGNELRWEFSARQPCDVRKGRLSAADCFDRNWAFIGPYEPSLPKELSLSQLGINASGQWRTKQHLKAGQDKLKFSLMTPVTLFDSYCEAAFFGGYCGPGGVYVNQTNSGPPDNPVEIEADWVNPIPVKELRFSPKTADGAKREEVTGTVQLERAAAVPVEVRILSNSENAVVGAPLGNREGSQTLITIDPGKSSGTFRVRTNDNKLKRGEHTIASITAFYTEPTTEEIRIESR